MPPRRQSRRPKPIRIPRLPGGKGKRGGPPLLQNVLQAIADLREVNGSTIKRITDQVQAVINATKRGQRPRNVPAQVRRALKHAVNAGVLVLKSGRYKLSAGPQACRTRKRGSARKSVSRRPATRRRKSVAQKGRAKDPVRSAPSRRRRTGDQNVKKQVSRTRQPQDAARVTSRTKLQRGRPRRRRRMMKPRAGTPARRNRPESDTESAPATVASAPSIVNSARSRSRIRKRTPIPRPRKPIRKSALKTRPSRPGSAVNVPVRRRRRRPRKNFSGDRMPPNYQPCNHNTEIQCDNPNCACNMKQESDEDGDDQRFRDEQEFDEMMP